MSRHKRFCLQCDDGTVLVHGARDMEEMVDTVKLCVSQVRGWHCPQCGECEFDEGEGERYSTALFEASKQAAAARAVEIRAIRKRLKLTQAQAAALFGGGVNAFSEYERGKTRPHKATMMLLRLLAQHPELLDDIRSEQLSMKSVDQQHRRMRVEPSGSMALA